MERKPVASQLVNIWCRKEKRQPYGKMRMLKRKKDAEMKATTIETTEKYLRKETENIDEQEKIYYREDEYYTVKAFEGTIFEWTVISFEERKKTSIPSANGLYVSEILLLHYCSKGQYPRPKNGYQGFWWFHYGIRDVGSALKSLEKRGFIRLEPIYDSLKRMTVSKLKKILKEQGKIISGKKAELVKRIEETVPEEIILASGDERKYILTALGQKELEENEYVPYMHSHNRYKHFTAWELNLMLGNGDKSDYRRVAENRFAEIENECKKNYNEFLNMLKMTDPEGYELIRSQDEQLETCIAADKKYQNDNDIEWIICFWEEIWKEGGPKFEGSGWMFRLPDLYTQAKRYDEAIELCKHIKEHRGTNYCSRAENYIRKLETLRD